MNNTCLSLTGLLVSLSLLASAQQLPLPPEQPFDTVATSNAAVGKAFLEKNGKEAGVRTLPSGLQYRVEKLGNGPYPTVSDQVKVNYRGTLLNGKEFDSSYKRGAPDLFAVRGVIPGLSEALQRMRVGARWKLFIPAELAYGAQGEGDLIPPSSVLLFDLELLQIVAAKPGR